MKKLLKVQLERCAQNPWCGIGTGYLFVVIVIVIVVCLFRFLLPANAHDAMHPDMDSFYEGLKDPHGNSCCSMLDCHPTEAELKDGHWRARLLRPEEGKFIPDVWVAIPDEKVLKNHNPVGQPIICHVIQWKDGHMDPSTFVRCFLPTDLT